MKKLSLITMLFLFNQLSAYAFSCKDTDSGPDHGRTAFFTDDMKTVKIEEISIAGTKIIAEMKCKKNPKPKQTFPDMILKPYTCKTAKGATPQFILEISSGGLAGATNAHFYEISKNKKTQISEMICKHNEENTENK